MNEKEPDNPSGDSTDRNKRAFADSTNPPVRSKQRFASRLRRFFKRYRTPLVILVTGALAVAAVISIVSDREETSEEPAPRSVAPASDKPLDQNQLLNAFLLKNLGGLDAEQLQSIRIVGEIGGGDTSRQFTAIKKRPNLAYLKLYLDQGAELTYGMNGGRVWRRINAPGSSTTEEWAPEDAARDLQSMTYFFSPLINTALHRRDSVESIEFSDALGHETIAIRFFNEQAGVESVAHLDPEDLSLLVRFDHLTDGRVSRSDFSDFRVIEGFRFPFSIVNQFDGIERQSIKIDRMALNPGVISDFFEPPSGLK